MTSSHPEPPEHLEVPLELDLADWSARERYRLLTGLVVPRPIAWVSTRSASGVRNLAPHSYFTLVSSDPPHVTFSSTGEKDTLRNIQQTGQFVINVVSQDLATAMNLTATDLPPEEDEFTFAEVEASDALRVDAPRVAGARAHLECELRRSVPVGDGTLVIGEVVHVHVDPAVWADGGVDVAALDPVLRLAGSGYAHLGRTYDLARLRWADVRP